MCPVGRGYDAAVAVGLLDEMVVLLHPTAIALKEFGIPLYGGEIGRREYWEHVLCADLMR